MIHQSIPTNAIDVDLVVSEAQTALFNMEEPIDRVRAFLNAMSHVIEALGPGADHNSLQALANTCEVVLEDLEASRTTALDHLRPLGRTRSA